MASNSDEKSMRAVPPSMMTESLESFVPVGNDETATPVSSSVGPASSWLMMCEPIVARFKNQRVSETRVDLGPVK